jgi:hypothetical protein
MNDDLFDSADIFRDGSFVENIVYDIFPAQWVDRSLDPGQSAVYKVRLVNDISGPGPFSEESTGLRYDGQPPAFTDFSDSDDLVGEVVCVWSRNTSSHYAVVFKDGVAASPQIPYDQSSSWYDTTDVSTSHTYFVRCYNSDGSLYSDSGSDTGIGL